MRQGFNRKTDFTNKERLKIGLELWPHTYKGGATDEQAIQRLMGAIQAGPLGHHRLNFALAEDQLHMMWAGRWVDQGCPRITMDDNYAGVLMATDVGQAVFDKIVFPWRAFMVDLPKDWLTTKGPDGNMHPFHKLIVHVVDRAGQTLINYMLYTPTALQLWSQNTPLHDMMNEEIGQPFTYGHPREERDDRIVVLVGRFILSLCVAMSDPDNIEERRRKRGSKQAKGRAKRGIPDIKNFVVGKPTTLNCKPAIVEYIEGGRTHKSATVQQLVRGHWKHQPHGPGRSERKLIKIDPYWRGPEEAPILARTIHLK
jgi:hypothetical protein